MPLNYKKFFTILQKKKKHSIFSGYTSQYSWEWLTAIGKPAIFSLNDDFIKKCAAIMIRDNTIAKQLHTLGVKSVLDIGADTGYFLAVLKTYSIEAVGIDSSANSCNLINKKKINKCYQIDLRDLLSINQPLGFDCISVMNITHVNWNSNVKGGEAFKEDFIKWLSTQAKYLVLSDTSNQSKKWEKYGLKIIKDYQQTFPIYSAINYVGKLLDRLISPLDNTFLKRFVFVEKLFRSRQIARAFDYIEMNKIYRVSKKTL
jgi:SAM-dependent methyltransferase